MSSEDWKKYSPTDPELIDKIVNNIKAKGIFDQFRKDCLADVDTKPAYQNLQQRVNGTVTGFLATQKWQHGLNKTQLRESLRRHTVMQAFLEVGVDRIVDQVVNPKICSVFTPKVEDEVCELLGIEKPKPKPLVLNFQKLNKPLEAPPPLNPVPVLTEPPPIAPSPEPIKEEKNDEIDRPEEPPFTQAQEPHPPDEKPPEPPRTSPTPCEKEEQLEPPKDEPASPAASVPEALNNDDDSNTIDEMPLLAASLDSDSNGGRSPLIDGAPQNSSTKIGTLSELSNNHSLLSRPPLEYESSTNNLSSLKSEEKMSPSKKFDNFSNLGEKLKQADVNLRETSIVKKEDIMEECSDVTKSSENDTESFELKIEPLSESNMSSVDAFRHESTKLDAINERLISEDSQSSLQSLKNIPGHTDDRSRSHKLDKKSSNSTFKDRESKSSKVYMKDESLDSIKDTAKKDQNKASNSSKHHQSKSRCKEDQKDKCKSPNEKEKHKSSREKSHNADEKHGKLNSAKDRKDKKDRSENKEEKKNEDPKIADSNKHSDKKKKDDDRSRHHSKDSKSSKGHRKVDDHSQHDGKEKNNSSEKEKNSSSEMEKNNSSEKEKNSDHGKSRKDSVGKSSRSKSDDKKHKDDKRKDDHKKDNNDDKKKSPRKRKSGRCEDDEIKTKNSRRSSDRDSNGNPGDGSSMSKPSNSSSHNGRRSSKSEKGRSQTKGKEASNHSDAPEDDYEMNMSMELDETDEVDMILMEINNSIQNENQRLNISEVLNEPSLKKPKIAKNFHEIKKIMQVRKDIDRRISQDVKSFSYSCLGDDLEEQVASELVGSHADIDDESHFNAGEEYTDNLEHPIGNNGASPVMEESNEKCVDEVLSGTTNDIELKNCLIVVTDVLKDQLKNSSISSLQNKRIVLKDGVVENITTYSSPLKEQDGGTEDVSFTENPSMSNIDNKSVTEAVVHSENGGSSDITCDVTKCSTGPKNERKGLKLNEVKFGDTQDHLGALESCSVHVSSDSELTKEPDLIHLEGEVTSNNAGVREMPCCSSDMQQALENETTNSLQSKLINRPKEVSSDHKTSKAVESSDQSGSAAVSTRSKRTNAGSLMYAILGINERNLSTPQAAAVNHSTKRKVQLETSKGFESVSEAEVRNPGVNTRNSQEAVRESLMDGEQVKACSIDDGSDVSNKENDEINVTGKTRSQTIDLVEPKNIETRTTKRKTLTSDLSEDLNKSVDNNNITKGRVSLKCKNNRGETECMTEEIQGKMNTDLGSKKLSTSISRRHSSKKCTTPLYSRNTELEKSSIVNSADGSCAPTLHDKSTFSEETCKSMESLHMDKENITVPATTCDITVESCLVSLSQRRKSCPDIFVTHEIDKRKSSSIDRVSTSSQQEKLSKSNNKIADGTLLSGHLLQKGTVAQTGKSRSVSRRSVRQFRNSGNNDSLLMEDNENGSRLRNRRKLSQTSDKLPNHGLHSLKTPRNMDSDQGLSSGEETLVLADMEENPCSLTINIDPPLDKMPEDEPPQVVLYFDDSPSVSYNSNQDVPKPDAPTAPVPADVLKKKKSNSKTCDRKNSSCSRDESQIREHIEGEGPSSVSVNPSDSLLEDSCSSEFKGFGQDEPNQNYLEDEYRGFTADEIKEATVQLRLLKQYVAKRIQSPSRADNSMNQNEGAPRAKKMRVASEGVGSVQRTPRKRNFSLNSSPEKDKKDVLGGQCKAESKDSGLCESPEQLSFPSELCRTDAVVEPGENAVRSTKTANAPATPATRPQEPSRKDKSSASQNNKQVPKTRIQRYSKTDLYKPRPVVGRDSRMSKTSETPTTTRRRPKRFT